MADAYLTVVPNDNAGPPTVQAFWPDKIIVHCAWFLSGVSIGASSATMLIPITNGYYKAILTADDETRATTDETYVNVGFPEPNFELVTHSPIPNGASASRYTDIVFDIVESNNRSFPLSCVNFFVYQNGALVEDLTKNSSYTTYSALPNGWHFIINGESPKHRFKYGSNIIVVVTVTMVNEPIPDVES